MARLNPQLAKLNRSYTVEEAARLFGVHRNTVRGWITAGLPSIDDHRPTMILGRALRAFLQDRRSKAKRPCAPGTLYCCKCRASREPAAGSVVFEPGMTGAGNLRALCASCGCRMFRRARRTSLAAVMPQIPVRIVEVALHIEERPPPSAIYA